MTLDPISNGYPTRTGAVHAPVATGVPERVPRGAMTFSELTAWALLVMGVAYWANVARSTDGR